MKVVFSTPDWSISGVNSFNHNLMRGLQAIGHDVELLVIPISTEAQKAGLPLPDDIPVRHLEFDLAEGFFISRWNALIAYLNSHAPCIYLPGYDFNHSCVAPCLANDVGIVGVVHSDDPYHYEHLIRLGRYWNACVAVSGFLYDKMTEIEPGVTQRSDTIRYGVTVPAVPPDRSPDSGPLRILYTGRFTEEQKRVSDLPKIARALSRRGVPAEWTLVGGGAQDALLRSAFGSLQPPGAVRFTGPLSPDAVLEHYAAHDCLILTSAYEGLPLSLLEAMAQGAIPVVTDLDSGIREVVEHGRNGFTVPVGDIDGFVDILAMLHADPARRTLLHRAAFDTISHGPFSIGAVTERYAELFCRVRAAIEDGSYRRPATHRIGSPSGDIIPPPHLVFTPDLYYEVKGMVDSVKRVLGPFSRPIRAVIRAYYRRAGRLRKFVKRVLGPFGLPVRALIHAYYRRAGRRRNLRAARRTTIIARTKEAPQKQ